MTEQEREEALRRWRGARSRVRGNSFEEMIMAGCDHYRALGLADIEKTPEPMQPTKDLGGGRFIAHYVTAAQADFKGTLRGGRAVNFEAKHTDTGRMEESRVTDGQTKKLNGTQRMGGLCFVLCSFGGRDFFRVPWSDWKNLKDIFGHKYITPDEAEPYRVKFGATGALLFLSGIDEIENGAKK